MLLKIDKYVVHKYRFVIEITCKLKCNDCATLPNGAALYIGMPVTWNKEYLWYIHKYVNYKISYRLHHMCIGEKYLRASCMWCSCASVTCYTVCWWLLYNKYKTLTCMMLIIVSLMCIIIPVRVCLLIRFHRRSATTIRSYNNNNNNNNIMIYCVQHTCWCFTRCRLVTRRRRVFNTIDWC
jgi:hypothetical protein